MRGRNPPEPRGPLSGRLEVETLDGVKPETATAFWQRLAGRRFNVLFVVVGRESQSLPSYLKETSHLRAIGYDFALFDHQVLLDDLGDAQVPEALSGALDRRLGGLLP